jgi:hypothetical protein
MIARNLPLGWEQNTDASRSRVSRYVTMTPSESHSPACLASRLAAWARRLYGPDPGGSNVYAAALMCRLVPCTSTCMTGPAFDAIGSASSILSKLSVNCRQPIGAQLRDQATVWWRGQWLGKLEGIDPGRLPNQ